MKLVLVFVASLIFIFPLLAQKDWDCTQKRGVEVCYRDAGDSYIKELKIETTVKSSLSAIMCVLYDVESYPDWVYSCSASNVEQQVSETEIYYYGRMAFPWPLWDRDFVAHSNIQQDSSTKIIKTKSEAVLGIRAEEEKVIRMEEMLINWKLTPQQNGEVAVEYYLKSNPGGSIPAWAVNLALDRGPLQSIKRLKARILQEPCKSSNLPFVEELETN